MSAMANATPIISTVKNASIKEKMMKETDAVPKASILDFCEEHYEDILPNIMDRARPDKRKEVQTRLDFGESPKKVRRERENSLNSRAGNSPIRFHHERSRTCGRERHDDINVFNRLNHHRKSVHERLSDTYSPSITKSRPNMASSRDPSHSRGRPLSRDRHRIKDRLRGIEESYGDTYSSHGTKTKCRDCSQDTGNQGQKGASQQMKKNRSYPRLARITRDPKDHLKIFQAAAQVECWAMPTWCHMFNSTLIGATRVWFDELPLESIDGYKGLKAAFLAYFMQQKKYVKDLVEIHNIKQRDGETIEEFIELNNPELIKRLDEHVPKTVEEMMTATTTFIRGETVAASKKKVHTPWKSQDQSKRHTSERRSDIQNQPKDMRGFNKFTPLTRMPKEIFAAKSGKFKPPPPMKSGKTEINKRLEKGRYSQRKSRNHLYDMAVAESDAIKGDTELRSKITFPPLTANKGTEGPLVIEAEIGGHAVHRIYVDGGSSMETVKALGNYRGRRALYKSMDEFYDMTIRSTILTPTECATIAATPKDFAKKAEARHKNFKVAIHSDFSDHEITIEGMVLTKTRTELCTLLKGNFDIFTWQSSDMKGVPRSIAENRLPIREGYSPEFYEKFTTTTGYPTWSWSNPSTATPSSVLWTPTNAIIKYRWQNKMRKKAAFHTSHGVYCHTKMPFGLKNADATYQRLADKAFDRQIGQNLEIYVDDLVIKSHTETKLLRDTEETFRTLQKINMKLNPKKCTFGAAEGMFLGYMISLEGIKPCPDKTEAVLQLPVPRTIKEVQSLNGKLASLNRFLSKSAEKYLPLFKTLNKCIKKSDFHWTPEAEQAFKQLKQHLAKLPTLVAPKPKEELIMYLSASYGAFSVVLMTERDTVQTSVYFVIRALQAPELNYTPMEKLVLALAITKMEHHAREHNITYRPRTFMKGQILVDILVEKPDDAPPEASVLVEVLKEKTIQEREMATIVEEEGPTWMTSIIKYLRDETLSDNRKEVRKLRIKAIQYELLEGILYRRSFLKPWLRATILGSQAHAIWVLLANHTSGCTKMIRRCRDCQIHRLVLRHPQQPLTPITAPWPFYKWGIDIACPFPKGPGKVKFLIVAMDYFIKWIEAKVVATITDSQRRPMQRLVRKLNIVQRFTSVKHLQSNRLVERANSLEAVIPVEIGMPTYRTTVVDAVHYDEELRLNLDLLEKRHERAAIREAKGKLKMTKYYNAKIRGVTFRPGDFVYRTNDASHTVDGGNLV
uniref:Reverse transcriptase domain-containing protein n=1 Tax=Tanacetum cinerariifolium TaxID=118510 RepID=A0A699GSU5_TANCI|nr:reverse transcriptase domain-containing protein [Tanacetum cinerariifolium]